MDDLETEEFISKIKLNDGSAIEKLVRAYTGNLMNKSLRLGFSQEEAEDIVQGTWITFFSVVQNFQGKSKLKTFLFGILFNKSSEFKKKNFRLKETENIEEVLDQHFDEFDHWKTSPISPEKLTLGNQIMDIISKCLELLPVNQKIAFQLKEIEEIETQEICETLNITSSNLGVLIFRARNQLRICVESKSVGGLNGEM